jgi:hypothetical protein
MDIHEDAIGGWPNIAMEPWTRLHAATGEPVEQPPWSRIGMPMTTLADAFDVLQERAGARWERMGYGSERDYNRDRFYDESVEM